MKLHLSYMALFLGWTLTAQLNADTIDLLRGDLQRENGSGLKAGNFHWEEKSGHKELVWTVRTSEVLEFDFQRIVSLVSGEAQEDGVLVFDGDLELAPDNFLDIALETNDGTLIYHALKESSAGALRIPLKDFSISGDKPIAFPYGVRAIKLMISGDKSPEEGENSLVLRKLEIEQ